MDNAGSDVHYDEPNPLEASPQAPIAPIASAQGPSPYDDEIRVRSSDKPPDVPPPRKESTATASTIPRTTSLPASFLEERAECSGHPPPPESQNRRASDIRPPDIPEKKRTSSHVIPAPPRRHSEDNTNTTTPLTNRLARMPSLPLSEKRNPVHTNMVQPSADESQQYASQRSALLRSDSVALDMHGYVKCIP